VLSEDKSTTILDTWNLTAEEYRPTQELLERLSDKAESEGAFDVHDEEDARRRELSSIVRRQGQPKFRQRLLDAYEGKCAISGFDAVQALEAAHIVPYNGEDKSSLQWCSSPQ